MVLTNSKQLQEKIKITRIEEKKIYLVRIIKPLSHARFDFGSSISLNSLLQSPSISPESESFVVAPPLDECIRRAIIFSTAFSFSLPPPTFYPSFLLSKGEKAEPSWGHFYGLSLSRGSAGVSWPEVFGGWIKPGPLPLRDDSTSGHEFINFSFFKVIFSSSVRKLLLFFPFSFFFIKVYFFL